MILNFLLNTWMIWMIFINYWRIKLKLKENAKKLIVFDDMVTDVLSNKKLNPKPILTKLSISLVFIIMHYFIMKIPNKPELQ